MKYLILFFTWLKKTLAKETLLTVLGLLIALTLSFITNKILFERLKEKPIFCEKIYKGLGLSKIEYWIFLFIFFMLVFYGIRFIESVIKTVLIKKQKKD